MTTTKSPHIGIVCFPCENPLEEEDFSYRRILLFLQQQACMAGISNELVDLQKFQKPQSFDESRDWLFLVPLFEHRINEELENKLKQFINLVESRQAGLIVLGFSAYSESQTSLITRLYDFLNLQLGKPISASKVELVASNQAKHVLGSDFEWNACQYSELYFHPISAQNNQHQDVANFIFDGRKESAIVAGEKPIRFVASAHQTLPAQENWLWRAIRWVAFGSDVPVGLSLSRSSCAIATRVDMDMSKFVTQIETVSRPLVDLFRSWKQKYGFICSAYINIGANKPVDEYTDWTVSAPLYHELMKLGNEIGSHSYTHPFNVSELSDEQIGFEFKDARDVIESNLNTPVRGCAIPGNPEALTTSLRIGKYYRYVSGRFSGQGDGYPGAIGRLFPESDFLYFCPNIWPDFTTIRFFKWPIDKALRECKKQMQALMVNARTPIIQPLWHDYAMTNELGDGFDIRLYESVLEWAIENESEFTTLREIEGRINTLNSARLTISTTESGLQVSVSSSEKALGSMCLTVGGESRISNVDNWQAYNDHQVFLPRVGGNFSIHLDAKKNDGLRIIRLPQGAELITLSGAKDWIHFQICGEGMLELKIGDRRITVDSDSIDLESSQPDASGNVLLRLRGNQFHTARVAVIR